MKDDGFIGWRVVSEADGGDEVNEEGIALLSKEAISFDQSPRVKNTQYI